MGDVGTKRFLCLGFRGELINLGNASFPEAFSQSQSDLCALHQLTDTRRAQGLVTSAGPGWELSPPGSHHPPGNSRDGKWGNVLLLLPCGRCEKFPVEQNLDIFQCFICISKPM